MATFIIITLSLQSLYVKLRKNDTEHNQRSAYQCSALYLLLCWVSLCWMSLCWAKVAFYLALCWVSLDWMSLCQVSWRPKIFTNFQTISDKKVCWQPQGLSNKKIANIIKNKKIAKNNKFANFKCPPNTKTVLDSNPIL
jgi:hypothetical protein